MGIPYKPDVKVTFRFLTTAEGGRKTLAFSGYRPQFYYDGCHFGCNLEFSKEGIAPGEQTEAEVSFLSPELHLGKISDGMSFSIYEGQKKVAEGKILEILALEENAERERQRNAKRAKQS